MWYIDDQPRGISLPPFSMKMAGTLTASWMDSVVADLVKQPHRFDRLLESAAKLLDEHGGKAKPITLQATAAHMYLPEHSSLLVL